MTKEDVLQQCTVEGNVVKLPSQQLDRKLYLEVAKALELIGGKWKGGKVFGFVFPIDPTDLLEQIAQGEKRNLKKEFQFFATPRLLAMSMATALELKPQHTVMEPSAGQGALIAAVNALHPQPVDCYELMDVNRIMLQKSTCRFNLIGEDFLTHDESKKYDRIIANPPFSKNQDIEHIRKMYSCLNENGRIVTVASESWVNGSQKKQEEFRNWLDEIKAKIFPVEKGTFKESGTEVGARLVIIDKD